MKRGFTLIELLVVISVIALLIAIALPALSLARARGKQAQCLSNQRQFGVAFAAYSAENRESLPAHEFWYNHAGKAGNTMAFGLGPFNEVEKIGIAGEPGLWATRPLNAYLSQSAEVSRCPGDAGDSKKATVPSCYEAYGVSYQVQWKEYDEADPTRYPVFGVVPVTGGATISAAGRAYDNRRPAARLGQPIRYGNRLYNGSWSQKIIQGDFNWHGNRPIDDPRVLWHPVAQRDTRQQNMLFGDGHAEFFAFPAHYGAAALPVDRGVNGFW